MLILGVIIAAIGALIAAFAHHTIGILIAIAGLILILIALLYIGDAHALELARSSWSSPHLR